jgi:hypothetical protein
MNLCSNSVSKTHTHYTSIDEYANNKVQFIKEPLREELELPRRERERCYGSMIHFIYLGTQLWQKDWHKYKKLGKRVKVWSKIQNSCFFPCQDRQILRIIRPSRFWSRIKTFSVLVLAREYIKTVGSMH